ncbi:reductive dehalogenase [bacterium]|nr:reductive dehalogenase [bacterium]
MKKKTFNFHRRQFLKATGAASAVLGGTGIGLFGIRSGKDPMTYSGTESLQGMTQNFNRSKYEVDTPTYKKVGETSRIDARTEVIFARMPRFGQQWDDEKGLDSLDPILKKYYQDHPEDLELDLHLRKEIFPKMRQDKKKYGDEFILAEAWSNAMGAVWPRGYNKPPEETDFPHPKYGRKQPLELESPEMTAKLIKKMGHEFGSTLVGICKLNPEWVYKHPMRGRGFDTEAPLDVPSHWEYAIVVGTPMEWDAFYANPNYGTSHDSYAKSRIVAYRMAAFIKELGYAARAHTPGTDYDLVVPPILIDAGIGEQGRHSVVITPELGSNFRPAIITTNIPMAVDKPIDFGVQDFCKTCKICAEQCPSGAITMGDKENIKGYKRYALNVSKCHNFWYSNLGNIGCRLCVAVCPYSRKSNWLHKTALQVTANDPTGITHSTLTEMQKRFYPAPDVKDYYIPSLGGKNASYRKPPWWLRTRDFIKLKKEQS